MKTIIIIGSGPAGMFAAINAKTKDNKVIILESNDRLGKKLAITGKGRCNLTNSSYIGDFISQINSNSEFMYGPFFTFTNENLMDFFETNGLKLKTERGDRVFPETDSAFDVIDVLRRELNKRNIEVIFNTKVTGINKTGDNFIINTNNGEFISDICIIATGGMSYPRTGSDGSGYELAKSLGHEIIKPLPSLVPIEIKEKWVKSLTGVSLKNIELSLVENNKVIYSEFGEMIFSHYGISGPIVLTLSNHIEPKHDYEFYLDLKPALAEDVLDKRILRDFEKYKNKAIKNALSDLTISSLIPIILELSGINPDKPVHQISKTERISLLRVFKSMKMTFSSLRPIDEAIITRGGVNVNEINPSTMESKIVAGLYFAGEIIDVDANTGGYNLQIAFSTAYVAGTHSKGDNN